MLDRFAVKSLFLAALGWFCAATSTSVAWAGDEAAAQLAKANEAYRAADYQTAAEAYQQLIKEEKIAEPVIFFNAANAAYKLEDNGRAVLNYRRALALDPAFTDASRNLKFLEEQTGLKFHDEGWLPPWFAALGTTVPLVVACAFFWAGLLALVWRMKGGRHLATTLASVFILIAVLSGALFSAILIHSPGESDFVIVEASAPLRTSPSDSAATAATLSGGEAVRLVKESGDWAYVTGNNAQPGWIRKSAMDPVIPD